MLCQRTARRHTSVQLLALLVVFKPSRKVFIHSEAWVASCCTGFANRDPLHLTAITVGVLLVQQQLCSLVLWGGVR